MFAELGHQVKSLKRVRSGRLELGDLEEGVIRKLSNAEIGKILRKSEGAVKSLYHRTLLELREKIREELPDLEEEQHNPDM
jgi:RNA polymerase sigma-70 factor (ECF subfamily)